MFINLKPNFIETLKDDLDFYEDMIVVVTGIMFACCFYFAHKQPITGEILIDALILLIVFAVMSFMAYVLDFYTKLSYKFSLTLSATVLNAIYEYFI